MKESRFVLEEILATFTQCTYFQALEKAERLMYRSDEVQSAFVAISREDDKNVKYPAVTLFQPLSHGDLGILIPKDIAQNLDLPGDYEFYTCYRHKL